MRQTYECTLFMSINTYTYTTCIDIYIYIQYISICFWQGGVGSGSQKTNYWLHNAVFVLLYAVEIKSTVSSWKFYVVAVFLESCRSLNRVM